MSPSYKRPEQVGHWHQPRSNEERAPPHDEHHFPETETGVLAGVNRAGKASRQHGHMDAFRPHPGTEQQMADHRSIGPDTPAFGAECPQFPRTSHLSPLFRQHEDVA